MAWHLLTLDLAQRCTARCWYGGCTPPKVLSGFGSLFRTRALHEVTAKYAPVGDILVEDVRLSLQFASRELEDQVPRRRCHRHLWRQRQPAALV